MRLNELLERWAETGGRRGALRRILRAVKSTGDFWEIVSLSDETLPEVVRALEFLEGEGAVKVEEDIIKWRGEWPEEIDSYPANTCPACGGRGVLPRSYVGLVERFRDLVKGRPAVKRDYDQAYMTVDSVWARIAFMETRDSLKGSRVFIIGDDDLISIALGLTGKPERITVLEIDNELTSFIDRVSEEENLPINTITVDIREPLPEGLRGKYDILSTEPTETLEAMKVFVGRGISALKGEGSSAYVGLTRREASITKWLEFEKVLINEFGVAVTDIVKDFSTYTHWDYFEETKAFKISPVKSLPKSPWYHSYLIRFELLPQSRGFEEPYEGNFYFDEDTSTI